MPRDSMFSRILRLNPLVAVRHSDLLTSVFLSVAFFPVSMVWAGEGLLAYVDIPYLIENAPQAQIASQLLEDEFIQRQQSIEVKREALEGLKTTIALESVQSDTEGLQELTQDYRSLERDLKLDEIEFREALNIRKNSEFKRIRGLVFDAVSRFGKLNKYDMIVSEGVLYVDRSVNVTDRILQNLIEQSKKELSQH